MQYKLPPLTKEEFETLKYMDKRGYSSILFDYYSHKEDEEYIFDAMPEHVAWQLVEDSHKEGFLTCCGSLSLEEKIIDLLDKII